MCRQLMFSERIIQTLEPCTLGALLAFAYAATIATGIIVNTFPSPSAEQPAFNVLISNLTLVDVIRPHIGALSFAWGRVENNFMLPLPQ